MFQCCHQILSVTEAEVHSQDEVSGCLSFQRYQKFQSIIKDRFETPVQLNSEGPFIYYVITCRVIQGDGVKKEFLIDFITYFIYAYRTANVSPVKGTGLPRVTRGTP